MTDTRQQDEDIAARLRDEADQCRNDGADDIARLLDEAAAALAAPQAEPVAWISDQAVALLQAGEGPVRAVPEEYPECGFVVPLYAAPPAPDAQEASKP